jgi:hypothetical protein
MSLRPAAVFGIFLALVVTVIAASQLAQWTPPIPEGAASANITQATTDGRQDCLERITNETGWLDLCWALDQESDDDPVKDYYVLRVYGTVDGEGSGIRWWRIRTNVDPQGAQVADSVFDGWPSGIYEGECREQEVALMGLPNDPGLARVCGRTVGEYIGALNYQVTWNCVGCLFGADRSAHEAVLYFTVGVPEREKPIFNIGADFGA